MIFPVLPLPRLVFGPGALCMLAGELSMLGVQRPLLISDRGLERAGVVQAAQYVLPMGYVPHLDVPENPTTAGADRASAAYAEGKCDGVIALGGGSVIDTAKIVAALAGSSQGQAADLVGRPDLITGVAPLIAIPTTIGTGSESSPVAALHLRANAPGIGTRSPRLVPRVAICDPDLARSLPAHLIAATGIDALSHCLEGFLAEPANAIVDALALDGLARAFADLRAAVEPGGEAARASLMAAAFAGGAAIHKGLGPAHAIALACSDQHLHHGVLIAAVLPLTSGMAVRHVPAKAARIRAALGQPDSFDVGSALKNLVGALNLPANLRSAGYVAGSLTSLVDDLVASPFNRTSPFVPSRDQYKTMLEELVS